MGKDEVSQHNYKSSKNMAVSASGRSFPKVAQGSLKVEKTSSAKILTTRNSLCMKSASARRSPRKKHPAQSVQSVKKGFSNKEQEHARNKNFSKEIITRAVSEGGGAAAAKVSQKLPTKVTILQRPQTKDEALSNISKFTGVPLAQLYYAKNGLKTLPYFCDHSNANLSSAMSENLVSADDKLSASKENICWGEEDGNHKQREAVENAKSSQLLILPISAVEEHESSDSEGDELFAIQEEGRLQFLDPKSSLPVAFSTDCNAISDAPLSSDPYFSAAEWSGLCLYISPPPTSLPIPKFATLATTKSAISEIGYIDDLKSDYFSSTASGLASPLEGELWCRHNKGGEIVQRNVLDTEVATNDLKRLLNLGFP